MLVMKEKWIIYGAGLGGGSVMLVCSFSEG